MALHRGPHDTAASTLGGRPGSRSPAYAGVSGRRSVECREFGVGVLAEPGDGAGDGALHGADADSEQFGDLMLGEVLDVTQYDEHTLPGGEPVEQAGERVAQ